MATITTIIDIGSNSMRMVVFKKTSRFAFHQINESKSKVKISEGCYENNGNLQDIPMQRAFNALESFLKIAKNLKSRKILCVATSALRDAPNSKLFISRVKKELKLNIKVIDGSKEAYYGGVATLNLTACDNFTTVDIGGGSTEFAFIRDNNIVDTVSLKIGTVRIKELYFNNNDFEGAKDYIISQLEAINMKLTTIVGLGGSARALSRIILQNTNYPLDTLHGFKYKAKDNLEFFDKIVDADSNKELKKLGVEKDRYDTIKTGTFIFKTILEYFEVKTVITSGVGVREGVYLTDLLRTSNYKFPANFNISIRSLLDRFIDDSSQSSYLGNNVRKIFDSLVPLHKLDKKYSSILVMASKLQLIGLSLNFDKNEDHAFWYILNGLNYGFTHEDKILIAILTKFTKKSLPKQKDIEVFKTLLPSIEIIQWLSFMMTLNISLHVEFNKTKYEYKLDDNILNIISNQNQYLVQRALYKIKAPLDIELNLVKD
ncbi:MAG: Ppx/GppA phosphatase family protein [Campylobacterota bacterium]|nr:Ppx/GppA phosphatase family protein [Campylobacterota bacterium]